MLSELPKDVFQNLSSLIHLQLTVNNIIEIAPKVFQDLTSLAQLDLYENELKTLEWNVFDSMNQRSGKSIFRSMYLSIRVLTTSFFIDWQTGWRDNV